MIKLGEIDERGFIKSGEVYFRDEWDRLTLAESFINPLTNEVDTMDTILEDN